MSEATVVNEEAVQLKKKDLDDLLRDNELLIERCSQLIERNRELEEKVEDLERSLTVVSLGRSQPHSTRVIAASVLGLLGGFIIFTQGLAFVINYSALVRPLLGFLAYSPLYSYLSKDNYIIGIAAVGVGGLLLICSIFLPVTSPRMIGGFVLFCSLVSLLVGGGYGLGALLGVIGAALAITVED